MITIQELSELGFEPLKNHSHDNFQTNRYIKGNLKVEKTWDMSQNGNGKPISCEVNICDNNEWWEVTLDELKMLDKFFNK
jgi:hypothetical protein